MLHRLCSRSTAETGLGAGGGGERESSFYILMWWFGEKEAGVAFVVYPNSRPLAWPSWET